MKQKSTFVTALNIVGRALVLLIFITTIFAAYGGYADPRRWVLPAIACMAFPILFPLSVVLSIISLMFSRRMAIAGGVAVLACLPSIFYVSPIHFVSDIPHEATSGTDTFSVMTFNAYYFNSFVSIDHDAEAADASAIAILEADPSIAVFQESTPYDPFEVGRRKMSNSISAAIRAHYPYRYFASTSMGIISKYPLKRVTVPYDRFDQSFIADRYDVTVGDSTVVVLNLHLQSLGITRQELGEKLSLRRILTSPQAVMSAKRAIQPRLELAFRKRAIQAHYVRDIIDRLPDGPVVVCGDFNDVPGCYALRVIAGRDFTDCYAASAVGPTFTYRSHHLYFRIDQMLCNRYLEPLYTRRVTAGGSDHYPLLTFFTFDR